MPPPVAPVDPPVEQPAEHGLFSAARLLPLSPHEELGITYDVVCPADGDHYWPGACRPYTPTPEPVSRTVTVSLRGIREGTDPDYLYSIFASATVDTGPQRQLTISVDGGEPIALTTDGTEVTLVDQVAAAGDHPLDIVDVATGADTHVTVTQATDGSVMPTSTTLAVADPVEPGKVTGAAAEHVTGDPFVVYGAEQCLLGLSEQERQARARQRLDLVEQHTVEHAFWTGEHGTAVALADSDPQVLGDPTTPVSLVQAVARLEQWLGRQSSLAGFIHLTRGAAVVAQKEGIVHRSGGRLETILGTTFVFGGGYPLTGPAGHPEQGASWPELWLFATRQPTLRRSEVFFPATGVEQIDQRKNRALAVAERIYIADVPCDTAAIKADLTICHC